jgi:hypothetical protein
VQDGARDADALPLAAREGLPAFAQHVRSGADALCRVAPGAQDNE